MWSVRRPGVWHVVRVEAQDQVRAERWAALLEPTNAPIVQP
jgi:hypothetical protein